MSYGGLNENVNNEALGGTRHLSQVYCLEILSALVLSPRSTSRGNRHLKILLCNTEQSFSPAAADTSSQLATKRRGVRARRE